MISAPDYQSLITQIYFTGDPYLDKDTSSAAPEAKSRILNVGEENGIKKVIFDCNMNDELKASYAALNKVTGLYKSDNNSKSLEFFEKDDLLWMKNEVFGKKYDYVGNNKFEYGGMPAGLYKKLHFDLRKDGKVKLTMATAVEEGSKKTNIYTKG